ncbi:MAG: protein kinase [Acidobacteria bacterium]|nr:protein kinase [Acidobacteriota bacterium]
MTPERWARVTELFDLACQLPPADREPALRAACDDESLWVEVRAMLETYDADPDFLEGPADPTTVLDLADVNTLADRRMGPYRLTREIGRGGMGVVYEARRDDQEFDRRAAVKILPSWSAAVLAERFRFEWQVLAGLDHPGIARLIDAGTTADGVPYCVMEYVDGQPIDAWCRAHRLDVTARVQLLERVCEAVAHAHGQLVVHRDLKPSNLLVTAAGQPKLLDFGIATLLDSESGVSVGTTRTGFTSFTPQFASPEQIRGERVSTASDVYALGVLLYLLLTDQPPHDLRGLSALETLRTVCEVGPPRPSAVAPPEVRGRLRGDLDTIVEKALRKDPRERYGSVAALRADLRAWREHRPIDAVAPSWAYRASRFVRRNTLAVTAGAVVLLVVLAGAAATARQARIAERERARADARFGDVRRLANAVVGPVYDAISKVPGSTEARRVLVTEALSYLDALSALAADDLDLKRELGDAYLKIGDVQGNLFYGNLGDVAGARDSYAKLLALRRAVHEARPGDLDARLALAQAEIRTGDIALGESHTDEAVRRYEAALAMVGEVPTAPGHEAALTTAARAHDHRGIALNWAGRRDHALAAFGQAVALLEPLAAGRPPATAVREGLMASYGNSGDAYYYDDRFADALDRFGRALALARQGLAESPTAKAQRDVHLCLTRVAYALKELGRLDEAAPLELEAIRMQEALASADANNVQLRFDLAAAHEGLAETHYLRKHYDGAFAEATSSLALYRAALAANPAAHEQLFNDAQAQAWLGRIEFARGHLAESSAALRSAVAAFAAPDVSARKRTAQYEAAVWLGDALAARGRQSGQRAFLVEARAAYTAAASGLRAVAADGPLPAAVAGLPAEIGRKLAALPKAP